MNGVHVCNYETMVVPLQLGLVVRDEEGGWSATEPGTAIALMIKPEIKAQR